MGQSNLALQLCQGVFKSLASLPGKGLTTPKRASPGKERGIGDEISEIATNLGLKRILACPSRFEILYQEKGRAGRSKCEEMDSYLS